MTVREPLERQATCEWEILGRNDGEIRQQVADIVADTTLEDRPTERRRDKRVAFPSLLTLTPIADTELTITTSGGPIHVVGKSLAERGLTFFHTVNLPFRRAIVSFGSETMQTAHLVLNITWSRFCTPDGTTAAVVLPTYCGKSAVPKKIDFLMNYPRIRWLGRCQ